MYDRWVRAKYIKNGDFNFVDYKFKRNWMSIFSSGIKQYMKTIPEDIFDKMHSEIKEWYDEVFEYVTAWLTESGYIKLKKGSFSGGFM